MAGTIRIFYCLCLAGATFNHIVPLLDYGWHDYGAMPKPVQVYWNALTLFDPLAIVLLIFKPHAGLLLMLFIMISDVGINGAVTAAYGGISARFVEQVFFLVIVLSTAPIVWRRTAPILMQ